MDPLHKLAEIVYDKISGQISAISQNNQVFSTQIDENCLSEVI